MNERRIKTAEEALAFVKKHGVVLASAKGPAPRLTEAIVGKPIKGSWWAHPEGNLIFAILREVSESEQVLVCRLINGRITLIHRRLWPALVRLADRFALDQLAQIEEEHTTSGRHVTHAVQFPQWVPPDIVKAAHRVSEQDALRILGPWLPSSRQRAHVA